MKREIFTIVANSPTPTEYHREQMEGVFKMYTEDNKTNKAASELLDAYRKGDLPADTQEFIGDLLGATEGPSEVAFNANDMTNLFGSIAHESSVEGLAYDNELLYGRSNMDLIREVLSNDNLNKDIVLSKSLMNEIIEDIYSRISDSERCQAFEDEVNKNIDREAAQLNHISDDTGEDYIFRYSYDVPVRVHSEITIPAFSKEDAIVLINRVLNGDRNFTPSEMFKEFPDEICNGVVGAEAKLCFIEQIGERNHYKLESLDEEDNTNMIEMSIDWVDGNEIQDLTVYGGFTIDWSTSN